MYKFDIGQRVVVNEKEVLNKNSLLWRNRDIPAIIVDGKLSRWKSPKPGEKYMYKIKFDNESKERGIWFFERRFISYASLHEYFDEEEFLI